MTRWLGSRLNSVLPFNPGLWVRNVRRMKRLVAEALASPAAAPAPDVRRIVVPVMPWNDSDVPWFSIICGLLLGKAGHEVTFIVDDLPFGDRAWRHGIILSCIRVVMRRVARRYRVVSLRPYAPAAVPSVTVADRVRELAALNALRDLRGEMVIEGRAEKTALFERQLRRADAAIKAFFDDQPCDIVLLPGGIHATSGVWIESARARGIRGATFDGGINNTALWAMNGVASHFADVPRLFDRLTREVNSDERDFVVAVAQAEIDARRAGLDKFGAQMKGVFGRAGPNEAFVVVALNVPWDTQALDRNVCFDSICQFIVETVRYVITNSSVHVVVRQHPAERAKMTRSNDDYRRLLADAFGAHPQVHFVASDDPVNTYALVERSIAVIVHTSTIGAEAALFGKPALTGARPYYARLGAVLSAPDLESFRVLLGKLLRRELSASDDMRRNAQVSYYLSQCNGWIVTPFNPGGFATWSRMRFDDIAEASQQRLLVESIAYDIPIAWQNHLLRLSERNWAVA